MTKQLLTVDGFRSSAKDGDRPDAMVVCAMAGDPQPVADTRRVKFVFSDGSVDRAGDTIDPNGWVLDNYKKNPVALFGHDSLNIDSVIGRTVSVGTVGNKLIGEIEFADADVNPKADMAYRMIEAGLISAVSVGFLPIEYAFSTDKSRPYGVDFTKQELLEISVVPVPCNGSALITARSLGIDTAPLAEWAERILDGDGKVSIPRSFLEETFRAAKTPLKVRQKYLSPERKDGAAWTVGAARDLPVADTDASWDGPAAAARMFAAAGFDGDSPDSAKVRRGFLVYDSANPDLKGSYKLPFADVVDGGLKAIPSGIRAAAGRLQQTDAPQEVLDNARNILDDYEEKMGSGDGEAATIEDIIGKAGNVLSSANRALLTKAADCMGGAMDSHQKAMDLHQQASDCVKSVMSSAGMMDDDGDEMDPASMPSDHVMGGKDLSPEAIVAAVAAAEADAKAAEELARVAVAARERRVRHANALKLAAEVL